MQITPEVQRDYDNLVWYKQAAVRIVALFYQIVTPDYATAFTSLVRYFKPLELGKNPTADKTHQAAAAVIHPPTQIKPAISSSFFLQKAQAIGLKAQNKEEAFQELKPFIEWGLEKFATTKPYTYDEQQANKVAERLIGLLIDDTIIEGTTTQFYKSLEKEFGGWILLKNPPPSRFNDYIYAHVVRFPRDIEVAIKKADKSDKPYLQSDLVEVCIKKEDHINAYKAVQDSTVARSVRLDQLHRILDLALSKSDVEHAEAILRELHSYLRLQLGETPESYADYFKAVEKVFKAFDDKELALDFINRQKCAPSLECYAYNVALLKLKNDLDALHSSDHVKDFETSVNTIFENLPEKEEAAVINALPEVLRANFKTQLQRFKDNPPPKKPLNDDLYEDLV